MMMTMMRVLSFACFVVDWFCSLASGEGVFLNAFGSGRRWW